MRGVTGAVHPQDPLPGDPPESALVERAPDLENLTEEQPQVQSEDASS